MVHMYIVEMMLERRHCGAIPLLIRMKATKPQSHKAGAKASKAEMSLNLAKPSTPSHPLLRHLGEM